MTPKNFDPSDVGLANGNLYGLPHPIEISQVAILPVPWAATVSYREGTERGPEAMLEASLQVDLYDEDDPYAWQRGIRMLPISEEWLKRSDEMREHARAHIESLVAGNDPADTMAHVEKVNAASRELNAWVQAETSRLLKHGHQVGLIGGEHSVPLGFFKAIAEHNGEFGILHIDAHADLREAYENFEYSHASIMYNALKEVPELTKLVQVGIRDCGHNEMQLAMNSNDRVELHTMRSIRRRLFEGASWDQVCDELIATLPEKVYISFDIDGLDPALCPGTGTPVPDGFQYEEVFHLLGKVTGSGRRIVGFDLVEVGTSEWDAIVGARVLLRLSYLLGASN